jgi:hypothetical protein
MPDTNETAPETGDVSATQPETGDAKDWKAEAEKWRALSRETEKKAKANAQELEQLRQQSMSDQEKAVAAARAEGRAEGLAIGTQRVVRAEIRAAAAGRLTAEQLDALLEATNLAVFIGEDGEVDEAKVLRFVNGIAPTPDEAEQATRQGFPDLGQGARGSSSMALNGDPLLRDLKAKLGVR